MKFFLAFIMIFNLISCSDNGDKSENVTNEEVETETLARGSMESRHTMFTYSNMSEFKSKYATAMNDVANANNFEISHNTVANCVKISSKVKFENGKALFEEYSYIDANNSIIEAYIYDPLTLSYIKVPEPTPYSEPEGNGGCAKGFTRVGLCEYGPNLEYCIGSTTSFYVIEQLEQNNSVLITVTNTLNFVAICAQTLR